MVFGEENTTDPATFGDIDSDGVTIPNVPLGNVFLVLRPDTETVLKSIGIPQMKDLQFIRRIETRKQKQMGSGKGSRSNATELAIDPKFLTGLSLDDQLLLVRAFVLYGRPNVDSSLKVAIVRGLNNIDVNFQVPTSK